MDEEKEEATAIDEEDILKICFFDSTRRRNERENTSESRRQEKAERLARNCLERFGLFEVVVQGLGSDTV